MKNVLLALLAINLLVWGWYTWVEVEPVTPSAKKASVESSAPAGNVELPPDSEAESVAEESSGKPVSLPSAADNSPAEKGTPEAPPELSIEPSSETQPEQQSKPLQRVCYRVGPLDSEQQAQDQAAKLESAGYEVVQKKEPKDKWVGHWVKVTGFDTKAAANEVVAQLKQSGLNDLYAMTDEGRWEISLGIFRNRASADRVYAAAQEAGVSPVMVDRYKAGSVWQVTAAVMQAEGQRPVGIPAEAAVVACTN